MSTSSRGDSPAPISSSTSSTARVISLELLLGRAGVDDVQDQVGELGLLERRRERVDELVRQLADEADGVGHQVGAALEAQRARRRVERVEEAVADADLGAGERVEQRRLAGVRVAGERDVGQVRALALGAHHRARGLHVLEPAAQGRDAVAREPAVGLDLRLARAPGADAADAAAGAETLEVRPQAAHAGHVVLELRELDLELAVGRVGVAGEDVEDHRGAVDAPASPSASSRLRSWRGVSSSSTTTRFASAALSSGLSSSTLPGAEVEVRVRLLALLDQLADDGDAGGAQQLLELGEIVARRARRRCSRPAAGRARCTAVVAVRHPHPL